mmetsp:Transcript_125983/g.245694  ORF Transcript_125983/g.245694 Transcript_125983/m.245694 type:complete len:912 (-) Transcript_125983:36-2771(-)
MCGLNFLSFFTVVAYVSAASAFLLGNWGVNDTVSNCRNLERKRSGVPNALASSPVLMQFWQPELRRRCGFVHSPKCGQPTRHICTDPEQMSGKELCPGACSYIASDPFFPCVGACVPSENCHMAGPLGTFPEPTRRVCTKGPILGCARYDQHNNQTWSRCTECVMHFELTDNGDCSYEMHHSRWLLVGLLAVAGLIILGSLPRIFFDACLAREGNPSVLKIARAHRERCLASQNGYHDPSQKFKLFPLWSTNMHKAEVAGAGLNMYYNFLMFLLVVSLLTLGVVALVQWAAGTPEWLRTQLKGTCTFTSVNAIGEGARQLGDVHTWCQWGLCFLWLLLFAASLIFVGLQQRSFRYIDESTSLMADFGLRVDGLPSDAFEAELEEYFRGHCGLQIVGVSVAYDFSGNVDLVERLIDRHLLEKDLSWWELAGMNNDRLKSRDQEKGLFSEGRIRAFLQALKGSGTAFVMFPTVADREAFDRRLVEGQLPLLRGQCRLTFGAPRCEPMNYLWKNLATTTLQSIRNVVKAFTVMLLACLGLGFIIYYPAWHYFVGRAKTSGDAQGDWATYVFGLIIAIGNGILYLVVYAGSTHMAFQRKGKRDVFNLIGSAIIAWTNTAFMLALQALAVQATRGDFEMQHNSERLVREELFRVLCADNLWYMLVPGILIVPDIAYFFYKYQLSLVSSIKYWVTIPLWPIYYSKALRADPNITPWAAERAMEPPPMQLEFDYSNAIFIVSAAFLMLFFGTGPMMDVCIILFSWVLVTYFLQQYSHLRKLKVGEYTSLALSHSASVLWGVPLSMVACASANYARLSAGTANPSLPIVAFVLALISYWLAVAVVLVIVPSRCFQADTDYWTAQQELKYDFFNTNPVHVLKTLHLSQGSPLVYFMRGKEYLQRQRNGKMSLPNSAKACC